LCTIAPSSETVCDLANNECNNVAGNGSGDACSSDADCPTGENCFNTDCMPFIVSPMLGVNFCDTLILVDVPTSEDCATDGVCDALGKLEGAGSQCNANGFCVTGDLAVALKPAEQTYTADASGDVLFGWADQGLTNSTLDPDTGLYSIPQQMMGGSVEQGLSVNAGGIGVLLACVMAVDSAGPDGVAVCVGGDNDGAPCTSPADIGNLVCFGGANDGDECGLNADCPDGVCENADCGPGATCEPADLASFTPDSALIRYSIP
jgi:hypothetical protein